MTERKIAVPFAIAALAWVAAGFVLCKYFSDGTFAFEKNLVWLLGLWSLCLLDLTALGKAVQGLLTFATPSSTHLENRAAQAIQTFSWIVIKLACLGIFGLALIHRNPVATVGLLVGLGTLIFVPLVGGLIWSQGAGVSQNGRA